MSNSHLIFPQIQKHLLSLTQLIQQSNKLNLTDEANHAEDLFRRILNIVFDLNLESSNLSKSNASTIDLHDTAAKTAIQITSNQSYKTKKTNTLKGFKTVKFTGYNRIVILFITSKNVSDDILDESKLGKKTYEGYDTTKLLRVIKTLTARDKKKLLAVLDDELAALADIPIIDNVELLRLRKIQPNNVSSSIIIDREHTVKELYNRALLKHTLVIGQPGIGKTFVLTEFNKYCWDNNSIAVTIKVNELFTGTDDEINNVLKVRNWLTYLNNIKEAKSQFLIFDAYDTAKDEHLKSNVLSLITTAMQELSPIWKILVSVRTYDASKSPRLIQIFSGNQNFAQVKGLSFEIEPLSNEQIERSLLSHVDIKKVYDSCTLDFKSVLHVPYFLKIFENVLENNDVNELQHLKGIKTEEELLNIYWQKTVLENQNHLSLETALITITNRLFDIENLNVPKSDILSIIDANILSKLIGDGVLLETGIGNKYLAYSHNILFDYAISKLIVKPDLNGFIEQIKSNPKRPFIFRPSYIYFLKQVWNEDVTLFWALYDKVFSLPENEFKIIHQILFNSVVAISYKNLNDIEPIFQSNTRENYDISIRKLLESIRFSLKELRELENDLILLLSENLEVGYLWHVGYYIDKLFQSPVNHKKAAKAATNYLSFIMLERKKNAIHRNALDGNGSSWGVLNICKAIKYYPSQCDALIKDILTILNENNFPISYFMQLASNIDAIAESKPKLAAHVFEAIYSKVENSNEPTHFGIVVGLTSNRSQDYGACYYRLEEYYKEFIKASPEIAIKLCLDLVNKLHNKLDRTIGKPVKLNWNNVASQFVYDGTFGDWDNEYEDGEGKLISILYTYLQEELATNKNISGYLVQVFKHSKIGFCWKNLLKFLSKNAAEFYNESYELLQNDILIIAPETSYEAGELIRLIVPYLTKTKLKDIEKRVVSLIDSNLFRSDDIEHREYCIAQTLSCFPIKSLVYKKSNDILKKYKGIRNRPIVSSYGGTVSKTQRDNDFDFIKRFNINIVKGNNKIAFALFNELKTLLGTISAKEKKSKGSLDMLFTLTKKVYQFIREEEIHPRLKEECDELITASNKIITVDWEKMSNRKAVTLLNMTKYYLYSNEWERDDYEKLNNGIQVMGCSSTARVESSYAFVNLSNRNDLQEISNIIERFVGDRQLMIRVNISRSILYYYRNDFQKFWETLTNQINIQQDDHVLASLLNTLRSYSRIKKNPNQTDSLLQATYLALSNKGRRNTALKYYVDILIITIEENNSEIAKQIVRDSYLKTDFIGEVLSNFFRYLSPDENKSHSKLSPTFKEYIRAELINITNAQIEQIKSIDINTGSGKPYFQTLDYIVQRMFFSLPERKNKVAKPNVDLYNFHKPIIENLLTKSKEVHGGVMIAHTGYYLSQYLELFITLDPKGVLKMLYEMVALSAKTGFTNDNTTLGIILRITETYLADYKPLILEDENFEYMLNILNFYAESGWQEALELIWRLNEIF